MDMNKLTFEACESLQDILLNKFANIDKEDVHR